MHRFWRAQRARLRDAISIFGRELFEALVCERRVPSFTKLVVHMCFGLFCFLKGSDSDGRL